MTAIRAQLLEMMKAVASALGEDLRSRLVFVGGCTTALFITDLVTLEDVRATDDIDLIVDLAGLPAWAQLQEELRHRGFMEAADEAVICRMRLGKLKVDFMPDDPTILGFGNRWYASGIETAQHYQLSEDLTIRILTPPMFLATKLEAYAGRGNGDLITSRDAEDILLIVDGREELLAEITASDINVRNFIAGQFRELLDQADFDDFLDGNIRGPAGRVEIVRDRFVSISHCADGPTQ
ncbi:MULTISPECIES: nucleotidyl transferase AbiEii/AbiGii toxin family protein [Agrobacterium]|uniref:nucleotidyl transferase AbiEii/AbiGii toxin family protein n=1 Tax=Agrobacterium TaxID=357 RepID=UPI0003661CBB|nr:nucleotidyl transferase AbiEii/AbiGii toxin family protein [Agrobacterium sp. 10MFCol1.1]UXU08294.1 nucleotidyl transferase AbiEii/AbiGii toxin family protein [Agrobacterium tumefaciens]